MKRLLIIGAGGFGREVYGWALDVQKQKQEWEIGGFLDRNDQALSEFDYPVGIIADPKEYWPSADDLFLCAIGDPATKLELCRLLEGRGAQFITLIHPSVTIGPKCEIGTGCLLCPGSLLTTNIVLGKFVSLNVCATVGHDVKIGDGSILSGHADVTGAAILGEGVFMGSHATVLPNAKVGDYARVGAGSVVLRSVDAFSTVFGVPAKQVYRSRNPNK